MFTEKDKEQIFRHGIDFSTIEQQIINFKKGFPYADLVGAATKSNGIFSFNDESVRKYETYFEKNYKNYKLKKFVPASGMASRMFHRLFDFCNRYQGEPGQLEAMRLEKEFSAVFSFIENLDRFAFYDDLKNCLAEKGFDINKLLKEKAYNVIIDYLVSNKGLNYDFLPKGLLKFHRYEPNTRTAIEEHLAEGAGYCVSAGGNVNIHFTLSPEHIKLFETLINNVNPEYEEQYKVKFNISHSVQSPSTDTIAVDMDNEVFREIDGSLIFRKGGHGALLKNLGELDADIVFIKNIDNVVPDRLKSDTLHYKKVIGGLLIKLQKQVFEYLNILVSGNISEKTLSETEMFCEKELMIHIPAEFRSFDKNEKINFFRTMLDRPIRVCGMVKNEGEPGGGPFWTRNSKGEISLQIVESSQVNMKDTEQEKIFQSATYFNPVDLVCTLKNYKGNKFDLQQFVDPKTGIISGKFYNGTDLKAQELPGLWNGGMANWITVFVEVPIITFNPVKTVNDLLRPEHQ